MPDGIIPKKSSVPGRVPEPDLLQIGELAINVGDRKLYSKDSNNDVFEVGNRDFNAIENKPSTLEGYGIVDGRLGSLSTGLWSGGAISVVNGSHFAIAAGIAQFVDYSVDVTNPTVNLVNFPAQVVEATNRTSNTASFIGIDVNNNVYQQPLLFTPDQRRDIVQLGSLAHASGSITNVNQLPNVVRSATSQLDDLMDAIGPLNIAGNVYSPNGPSTLQMSRTAGTVFRAGSNFQNNPKNPHESNTTPLAVVSFQYRYANGSSSATVSSIDPTQFQPSAGTLTTVNNNQWTVQRIYLLQNGNTRVMYGQSQYPTYNDAVAGLNDPFVVEELLGRVAVLRALVVIKKECTDLNDTATCRFIEVPKFGVGASGGGGGGGSSNVTANAILGAITFVSGNNIAVSTNTANASVTISTTANISVSAINTGSIGVTGNVTSNNIVAVGGVFDTIRYTPQGSSPAYTEGLVFYDQATRAISVYDDISGTSIQLGHEHVIRVYNTTGSTIQNGQVVTITGYDNSAKAPTVALAIANSSTLNRAIGVATHNILNNSYGKITSRGIVNDLNTTGNTVGAELWLSASAAGALVTTPPQGPNNSVVLIGTVLSVNNTTGSLLVDIDFESFGNLRDVIGTGLTGLSINTTSLSVLANSGLFVNTSGVFVNASTIAHGTVPTARLGGGTANSTTVLFGNNFWGALPEGTVAVTSVATGNGMTGGPITTTGTVSVLANNGIIANSTGVYVDGANGISVDSSGVNVQTGAGLFANTSGLYVNASSITIGTIPSLTLASGTANSTTYLAGNQTWQPISSITGTTNLLGSGNSTAYTIASDTGNDATITAANSSVAGVLTAADKSKLDGIAVGASVAQVNTGNGLTGGPIVSNGTISVLANSGIIANSTGVFVHANNGITANSTGVFARAANGITVDTGGINVLVSNGLISNTTGVHFVANSGLFSNTSGVFVNASTIAVGTILAARLPQANATSNGAVLILDSVTNTSIAVYAASANSVKTAYDVAIAANTRAASAQTEASAAYSNAVAFASNASNITTGTLSGVRLLANSGIVANATGIYVNANNGIIANSTGVFVDGANGISVTADGVNVLATNGFVSNTTGLWLNTPTGSGLFENTSGVYVNASDITVGTIPAARLPQANATSNGAVLILDSVTNTSISIYAASANSVKTAYDAAIAANTRAASAQTEAATAYSNAIAYASNADNLTTGTVGTARLASGTANTTTFLRGDQTWAVLPGGGSVTQVNTGNGLTGGPISTTGTISVVANSGIIANSTGVFVNASSIAVGTLPVLRGGTGTTTATGSNNVVLSHSPVLSGTLTVNGTFTTGRSFTLANSQILTLTKTANNSTTEDFPVYLGRMNAGVADVYIAASGNALEQGAVLSLSLSYSASGTNGVSRHEGLAVTGLTRAQSFSEIVSVHTQKVDDNTADVYLLHRFPSTIGTGNTANYYWTVLSSTFDPTAWSFPTVTPPTLDGTNSHNIEFERNAFAQGGGDTLFRTDVTVTEDLSVTGNVIWSGVASGNGQLITSLNATSITTGTVPTARLGSGTANSTTFLAGDQTYKTAVTSVATGNGMTGGPITTTGTVSVLANNGIVANSTGVFVDGANGISVDAGGVNVLVSNGLVSNTTGVHFIANSGLFSNTTGVFVNATAIAVGTVPAARLPQANATSNGAVLILDSVTNTSISIYAASANSVKTSYDAAIAANTRAASAQTEAGSAYSNAISFASNATNITTGTLSGARLLANSGIIANATGIYVNASAVALGVLPVLYGGTGTTTSTGTNNVVLSNSPTFTGTAAFATTTAVAVTANTLRLTGTGDATLAGNDAAFQVGSTTGANIVIDNNEILARNNGGVGTLNIQADGGSTTFVGNITFTNTFVSHVATPETLTNLNTTRTGVQFVYEPFFSDTVAVNTAIIGTGVYVRPTIAAGNSVTGTSQGINVDFLRNNETVFGDDNGSQTVTSLGLQIRVGHTNTSATATPISNAVEGLRVQPFFRTGSMTSFYGVRITAPSGTSAFTPATYWSLASEDANATFYHAGPMRIASGSNTTPSIHAISDQNTGFTFPTTDTIGFVTGGSQRATVNSTTLSLSVPLNLSNNLEQLVIRRSTPQYLVIENNDTTVNPVVTSYSDPANAKEIIYNATTNTAHGTATAGTLGHRFRIQNVDEMVLSNTGLNVFGVVNSSVSFHGLDTDTVNTPSFSWSGDTTTGMWRPTTSTIGFSSAGVETMRMSGNVAIGTTSLSGAKLFVTTVDTAQSIVCRFDRTLTYANSTTTFYNQFNDAIITLSDTVPNNSRQRALYTRLRVDVPTGNTSTGTLYAHEVNAFRNNRAADTDDNGTVADLVGSFIQFGNSNTNPAAAPTTTSALGIRIQPYARTGTTTTLAGIRVLNETGTLYTTYFSFLSDSANGILRNAGPVHIADGSNTSPSLTFTNDQNVGLSRPTTDTLALIAGGVAELVINSTVSSFGGDVTWTGQATGNGQSVTINGSNITTGTVSGARLLANNGIVANATGIYVDGANGISVDASGVNVLVSNGLLSNTTGVHFIANSGLFSNTTGVFVNATAIAVGTVPTARLGSGTANSTTYLRGDQTWATLPVSGGTVTQVNTGNGLTGGPITGTGTISVVAGEGIISNATGVYVATGTGLFANSSGLHVDAGTISTGTVPTARLGSGTANSSTFLAGDQTYKTAVTQITVGSGLSGGTITTTNTIAVIANSGIAANTSGVFVVANNGIVANSTGVFVDGANGISVTADGVNVQAANGLVANTTGLFVANAAGLFSNTTGLYVNASAVNVGTLPVARGGTGTTTATGSNNVVLSQAPTFTGSILLSDPAARVLFGTDVGGSMSLGRVDNVSSTPYIDFHSGSTSTDYDVRMIASSGNGTSGFGTLTITSANVALSGHLTTGRAFNVTNTYSVALTKTANNTTSEDVAVYLGRMRTGQADVYLNALGNSLYNAAKLKLVLGFSSTGTNGVSVHQGLAVTAVERDAGFVEFVSVHSQRVDNVTADVYILHRFPSALGTGNTAIYYWSVIDSATETTNWTRPTVTPPTLDGTNIHPIPFEINSSYTASNVVIRTDVYGSDIYTANGTAALPSISFTDDPNTGLFSNAADTLGITVGGTQRASVNTTILASTLPFRGPIGSNSAPALSTTSDTDTGITFPADGQLGIVTNAVQRGLINTTAISTTIPLLGPIGSNTAASYAFSGDPDTGILSPGADQIAVTVAGTRRLLVNTTAFDSTLPLRLANGTNANPSYSFSSDPNTGITLSTTSTLNFITGGTVRATINAGSFTYGGIEIGYRSIPITNTGAVTAAASIRGQAYSATANVTVPASTFSAGDVFTVYNNSAAAITIVQGTGLTLRTAGTATTGNVALPQRGVASILFITATEAVLSGSL